MKQARVHTETALQICTRIAARHNITIDDLVGDCQRKPLLAARFDAYGEFRAGGWNDSEIGREFGRCHQTIARVRAKHKPWPTGPRVLGVRA